MNIFLLDPDIKTNVESYCDKHVVKMILEYAQMLSSAVSLSNNIETRYKVTHKNHPCSVWARESLDNWNYLYQLTKELNNEYRFRYDKNVNHKSWDISFLLPKPIIKSKGLTPFPLCMPEEYKTDCVYQSYRNYYLGEKSKIFAWKNRDIPGWINERNCTQS